MMTQIMTREAQILANDCKLCRSKLDRCTEEDMVDLIRAMGRIWAAQEAAFRKVKEVKEARA